MFERVCLVHYHELGLKGHNRAVFERRLVDNLKAALSSYPVSDVTRISGHLLVMVDGPDPVAYGAMGAAFRRQAEMVASVAEVIRQMPGVARVSSGWRTERDLDSMGQVAELALRDCEPCVSFKVIAHRSNTDFEVDSREMNVRIGAHLHETFPEKAVQMVDPEASVHVDVVQGSAYVYARSERGVGGLPVGSAGKVVCLLSGGIDSPVAAWRLIRRGAVAVGVHFSGRPQTSSSSEEVVSQLVEALAPCAGIGRVYVVAFGDYQRAVAAQCDPDLRVLLYRRLMFAVAERIARIEGAMALVTGESLGQVASQTLENILAVDEVAELPIFRPLIGDDKQEIIEEAKRLRTFAISTQDHADCCTLFMPRHPETHVALPRLIEAWEALPHEDWVERIVRDVEYHTYTCPAYRAPKRFRAPQRIGQDGDLADSLGA